MKLRIVTYIICIELVLSLFYLWESIKTIKFYSLKEQRILANQIELMSLEDAISLKTLCIVILLSLLVLYRYRNRKVLIILVVIAQVTLVLYCILFGFP